MRVPREILLPLLAGHVAWSMHLMASYLAATAGCAADPEAMPVVRLGLTAVAVGVTVWASTPAVRTAWDGRAAGERRYAAGLTLALNAVFLFAILAAGATSVFVAPCV